MGYITFMGATQSRVPMHTNLGEPMTDMCTVRKAPSKKGNFLLAKPKLVILILFQSICQRIVGFKLDLRQGEFFQAEKGHLRKTKIKRFTETENARRV